MGDAGRLPLQPAMAGAAVWVVMEQCRTCIERRYTARVPDSVGGVGEPGGRIAAPARIARRALTHSKKSREREGPC